MAAEIVLEVSNKTAEDVPVALTTSKSSRSTVTDGGNASTISDGCGEKTRLNSAPAVQLENAVTEGNGADGKERKAGAAGHRKKRRGKSAGRRGKHWKSAGDVGNGWKGREDFAESGAMTSSNTDDLQAERRYVPEEKDYNVRSVRPPPGLTRGDGQRFSTRTRRSCCEFDSQFVGNNTGAGEMEQPPRHPFRSGSNLRGRGTSRSALNSCSMGEGPSSFYYSSGKNSNWNYGVEESYLEQYPSSDFDCMSPRFAGMQLLDGQGGPSTSDFNYFANVDVPDANAPSFSVWERDYSAGFGMTTTTNNGFHYGAGYGEFVSGRETEFSRKVFIGGLPPDVAEEEISAVFRRFGPLIIDWPYKSVNRSYFPPKGYAFLLFQNAASVQQLVYSCMEDAGKLYFFVSSPSMRDKLVQIKPWRVSDKNYVLDSSIRVDPRKTVFIGGVPRPMKAEELAMIMEKMYGGVYYASIDTEPGLEYPKGSGHVTFFNQQSYVAAISSRFVLLQHGDISKRVEVNPYVLNDQMCDVCRGGRCNGEPAPFFCRNVSCLQYYCEQCWSIIHSQPGRENHTPVTKEDSQKRPRPFRGWNYYMTRHPRNNSL